MEFHNKKNGRNINGQKRRCYKKILLREIAVNNYVPSKAQDAYGHALLREFKIAQGLLVAEEPSHGLNIAVLDKGCISCNQLENDVRNLLSEMKIAANLRHITDLEEIARH